MTPGWSAVTAAIEMLDAVRADLRQARSGVATCRIYDVRDGSESRGSLIEILGGTFVVFWRRGAHVELLGGLDAFAHAHPNFALVMKDHGSAAQLQRALRQGLLRTDAPDTGHVLSDKDLRVIRLVTRGMSNGQIGLVLGVVESTVKNRLSRIYQELGVTDRLQLVLKAQDMNLPLGHGAEEEEAA